MSNETAQKEGLKQKAKHELVQFGIIFLYLAFFFCAVDTYGMLLLDQYHVAFYNYAFALIDALVIAKVILIGEYAHLGKKHESKPLFLSAIYKAFLFGLLVFGFHIIEEVIKRLVHGENMPAASHNVRVDEVLARSLVVFSAFVPLFAFRELRRVLGDDGFQSLFFRARTAAKSDFSRKD